METIKPRIYLETTIASYLTARPSRDLIVAAHQQLTWDWWQNRRVKYDIYISQPVLHEAGKGDPEAAIRRVQLLREFPLLELTRGALQLSQILQRQLNLPEKASADALHIAVSTVNRMDYLLTWNCTHIANASMRHKIERLCRSEDYEPPVICTPVELMEG